MTHLFQPYSPFSFLITFEQLHRGHWKVETTDKQDKEECNQVKVYVCLKNQGVIQYEATCSAASLKQGKTKSSLEILRQMYGRDAVWETIS
jgi:hypothetical protein